MRAIAVILNLEHWACANRHSVPAISGVQKLGFHFETKQSTSGKFGVPETKMFLLKI